jgi:hypothetical protein
MLLVSCSSPVKDDGNINPPAKEPTTFTIQDYFPSKENLNLKYNGTGNEYAQKEVYVDYVKDNRVQLRVINPGTTLGQVFEVKDGELRLITSKEEFYYLDDLTTAKNDNPEVFLKEPLVKGTSWTLPDGKKRYISGIDVEVSTPSGSYKALEVTTEQDESKTFDYYVLNIGLVKSVFRSGDTTVETSLEKIEENASVSQTLKFYYPDFINGNIVFVKNKIQLNTNSDIKGIFEENLKKSPNKDIPALMSSNAKINRLYLDNSQHRVHIDFSKEFITDMNAGSGLEADIIQSITNTLGDYYNVDKVYISVDGKPYESGHISITESESFYVDYNNIQEYK